MTKITEDPRPIRALTLTPDSSIVYEVGGPAGVQAITPYEETDGSLWFVVDLASAPSERVNGRFVCQVVYQPAIIPTQ